MFVDDDVDDRVGPLRTLTGRRCCVEDRLECVEVALCCGARQCELFGLVAVFGASRLDVFAELGLHEPLVDADHLGGRQRTAAPGRDVDGPTDLGDECGAVLEVGGQFVERAVEVGQHHEPVDTDLEIGERQMFGVFEQHGQDRADEMPDARIGARPGDLERLRDADVAGLQLCADGRERVDDRGEPAIAGDLGVRPVAGGTQVALHRVMPVSEMDLPCLGHRQQGRTSSNEVAMVGLEATDGFIQFRIREPPEGLEEICRHVDIVSNICSITNPDPKILASIVTVADPSVGRARAGSRAVDVGDVGASLLYGSHKDRRRRGALPTRDGALSPQHEREAVNLALRHAAGEPLGLDEARSMRGNGWDGDLDEMRTSRM